MDKKNYDELWPQTERIAVRGIIIQDKQVLMISSKDRKIKLPGGGKLNDERSIDTLLREVLEETGYRIIQESIQEIGEIEEKRMSYGEKKIWHQINRYYSCNVINVQEACNYSVHEIECGCKQVWLSLSEVLENPEFNERDRIAVEYILRNKDEEKKI